MVLGSNRPFTSRQSVFDGLHNEGCGTNLVCLPHDLEIAFGVNHHFDAGIERPHNIGMRRLKMLVDRTVTAPENDFCLLHLFRRQTTVWPCLVVQNDFI